MLPSAEWSPRCQGWLMCRVVEGAGYWLQQGGASRQLAIGDGVVVSRNPNGLLRASQLGPMKLQFFTVHPQYLNGLLTVAEWHQFEIAPGKSSSHVLIFTANETVGQKFMRIATQLRNDKLPMRCSLLQLWANAVSGLLSSPAALPANEGRLRERFREFVGQLPEIELSESLLADLAKQLNCSERHFSRLFREEFGVSLRARQIELRLQRARQLLTGSNAKIISVAYESGYRHLGLFNSMFKKRFGVTPSEWRHQNMDKDIPVSPRNSFLRAASRSGILLVMLGLFSGLRAFAQTNPAPMFHVEKYLASGNSILTPEDISGIFTNVPAAFGTNVSFDGISAVLGDLQTAYRERGFVTVSVGLPQQKLTNATVKVRVIEGRLVAINVSGNHYFSSNNVMRALPGLHTNMLLNSKVFQRELDNANASRDRQVYPVIAPGPEPGTSELTLKVKEQLPLHARVEVNNQGTPGTPPMRVNFNSQYDNLWDLEHQVGLQYSFSNEKFKTLDRYSKTSFDAPLIASYSGYYRLPAGGYPSVQQQVDDHSSGFGYDEASHQFRLPPPTGRPEATFYASRSTSDTGVNYPTPVAVGGINNPNFTITTNTSGQIVSLNEDLGGRFSMPLPTFTHISGTLSFGIDYKNYKSTSYQTNGSFINIQIGNDPATGDPIFQDNAINQAQPPAITKLDYLPFNFGLNGSVPDPQGTTFFNAGANWNILPYLSRNADFAKAAYTSKARANYVSLQLGASREQKFYKNWAVLFRADGQWANGALISNEQYAMGGVAGVRGYSDGAAYGDAGWRATIEPRTPLVNIGMVDGNIPCWIRGSIFVDYGQTYLLQPPAGNNGRQKFLGAGLGMTANIGSHLDGRISLAWPVFTAAATSAGDTHVYFGIGAQF